MSVGGEARPTLTVLTVSYRSENLIIRNIELSRQLNSQLRIHWVVVDNEPTGLSLIPDRFAGDPLVQVISGPPSFRTQWDEGSYHHATGLMTGLPFVTGDFLLVLDPDCYLVRPNWAEELLSHMRAKELSFLGSLWDPTNISKMQGFPSIHCLFVDLKRVPARLLDFSPDLRHTEKLRGWIDWLKWERLVHTPIFPWIDLVRIWLGLRSSRDTGYRIATSFGRCAEYRSEVFDFVLPPEKQKRLSAVIGRCPKLVRRFVPRLFRLRPKNVVNNSSSQLKLFDDLVELRNVRAEWDEFSWQGKMMAIHLRRVMMVHRSNGSLHYGDDGKMLPVLQQILQRRAGLGGAC